MDVKMNSATEIIKSVRAQRGLSQEQMATDLGVTANYISLIENSKKKPGMKFLEDVASKYDVPLVLLAKDILVPEGKTKKEKAVRGKVMTLIADLEKIFLSA